MFVIKEMKLNKFQPRPLIPNRDLFIAQGENPAVINSKDTSECFSEPNPFGATKTEILGLAQDIGKAAYAKHMSAGKSPDLDKEIK